ncbi:MAG TPA: sigma 54-interacting transcriptional regulator, partial [Candidatus Tectomicrobia bacterium]|nr:sigma 54-interacting transcriptional regulator [Candidatus Tectomicrobia bacterium]
MREGRGRAAREHLDALVEGAGDGLVLLDERGIVLHLNALAAQLLGLRSKDALGAPVESLGGAVDWAVAREAARRGIPVAASRPTPGGATLLVTARPVASALSAFVVVSLRDVSEATRLMERFQRSAEVAQRRRPARALPDAPRVVGSSAAIRLACELARRYAAVDLPVLLLGETGTGKGLFAELIHRMSARAGGPLLEVNCGALPETLVEAELFGYARGAFTGADARGKAGLVELAEGGTLVLDEIGDLPPAVQVKLLHFLDRGEFRPLGAARARRPDVRVVAATNRDLAAMVEQGAFRADLFYRLNVLTVRLPALRERPEDVPALVEAILDHVAARLPRRPRLSPEALERLARHRFPGNVRELANLVERLAVVARSDTIGVDDLPPELPPPDGERPGAGRLR